MLANTKINLTILSSKFRTLANQYFKVLQRTRSKSFNKKKGNTALVGYKQRAVS